MSLRNIIMAPNAINEEIHFSTTYQGDKALITGPSDFGAQCPSPTYEYAYSGVDYCCCSGGCCWASCVSLVPPADCLQGWLNFRYKAGHS